MVIFRGPCMWTNRRCSTCGLLIRHKESVLVTNPKVTLWYHAECYATEGASISGEDVLMSIRNVGRHPEGNPMIARKTLRN